MLISGSKNDTYQVCIVVKAGRLGLPGSSGLFVAHTRLEAPGFTL